MSAPAGFVSCRVARLVRIELDAEHAAAFRFGETTARRRPLGLIPFPPPRQANPTPSAEPAYELLSLLVELTGSGG